MRKLILAGWLVAGVALAGVSGTATGKIIKKANFSSKPWTLRAKFLPREVSYSSEEKPGTIIINTARHYLYLVMGAGKAMRYGIGVGRDGFRWKGVEKITRKREWPDWTPPAEMIARDPSIPHHMKGGPDNPLGARAMYLGSTLYRIHGTAQPWTVGTNVSSGCIRLRNEDVSALYAKVKVGTKVIIK